MLEIHIPKTPGKKSSSPFLLKEWDGGRHAAISKMEFRGWIKTAKKGVVYNFGLFYYAIESYQQSVSMS